MYTEPFAPHLTINRVYNAILIKSPGRESVFLPGQLVRAVPFKMTNGEMRWSINRPPYAANTVVPGDYLVPILRAE